MGARLYLLMGDLLRLLYNLMIDKSTCLVIDHLLETLGGQVVTVPFYQVRMISNLGRSGFKSIDLPTVQNHLNRPLLEQDNQLTFSLVPWRRHIWRLDLAAYMSTAAFDSVPPVFVLRLANLFTRQSTLNARIRHLYSVFYQVAPVGELGDAGRSRLIFDHQLLRTGSFDGPIAQLALSCIPSVLCHSLRQSDGLTTMDLVSFGLIYGIYQLTFVLLFTSPPTAGIEPYFYTSTELPSVNLLSLLNNLHKTISQCLSLLRSLYAPLVSAGSCITARHRLQTSVHPEWEQFDESDPRLAEHQLDCGRARLFPSASTARALIITTLTRKLIPELDKLFSLSSCTCVFLGQVHRDWSTLGAIDPQVPGTTKCLFVRSVLTRSFDTSKTWSYFLESTSPSPGQRLSLLTHTVVPFIRLLEHGLDCVKTSFEMTETSLQESWIKQYGCQFDQVQPHADEDMRYLVAKLQCQLDHAEAWVRQQQRELLHLGSRMQEQSDPLLFLTPATSALSVPFGSKNLANSACKPIDELMSGHVTDWTDLHIDHVECSPAVNDPGDAQMVQPGSCESFVNKNGRINSQSFVKGEEFSAASRSFPGQQFTKRVVVHLPGMEQRDPSGQLPRLLSRVGVADVEPMESCLDRRQLGRMKRRLKSTNNRVTCAENDGQVARSGASLDVSTTSPPPESQIDALSSNDPLPTMSTCPSTSSELGMGPTAAEQCPRPPHLFLSVDNVTLSEISTTSNSESSPSISGCATDKSSTNNAFNRGIDRLMSQPFGIENGAASDSLTRATPATDQVTADLATEGCITVDLTLDD